MGSKLCRPNFARGQHDRNAQGNRPLPCQFLSLSVSPVTSLLHTLVFSSSSLSRSVSPFISFSSLSLTFSLRLVYSLLLVYPYHTHTLFRSLSHVHSVSLSPSFPLLPKYDLAAVVIPELLATAFRGKHVWMVNEI